MSEKVVDLEFKPEEQQKKIKILTVSDHPLSPSGVGTQTKYFITELLKTGKYQFISLGGAIKHEQYRPVKTEDWGDDWIIYPIDGYGNPDIIRSMLRTQKPDILWFMTDPRFYPWLWEIENEIRALVPTVYYHVWDNFPYPRFNKVWYDSTDVVVTISKLTSDIVRTVAPDVEEYYLPHAIPTDLFKKVPVEKVSEFRRKEFDMGSKDFLVFWNNRNARRKQSGSLIFWFDEFLKKIKEKDKKTKVKLLMHTEPNDPNGQDLMAIINELGYMNKEVLISTNKMPADGLALLYSAADVTINIADAEGFGLATFESMACETPIIVTMTGGLQEQVGEIEPVTHQNMLKRNSTVEKVKEYPNGIGLEPSSKAIIGSQDVPFIYEDRLTGDQVSDALMKMYEFGPEKRAQMGKSGREHVLKNYSFENFANKWEEIIANVYEKCGSWDNRKNYKSWECKVI